MRPRGGVVTQRTANPSTAGSSPARGLHTIEKIEDVTLGATFSAAALLIWLGTRRLPDD